MIAVKLTKSARKIHRWLAYPAIVLVPVIMLLRLLNPQFEQKSGSLMMGLQSVFMLALALTGLMLILGPYLIKRRNRTDKTEA